MTPKTAVELFRQSFFFQGRAAGEAKTPWGFALDNPENFRYPERNCSQEGEAL